MPDDRMWAKRSGLRLAEAGAGGRTSLLHPLRTEIPRHRFTPATLYEFLRRGFRQSLKTPSY